MQPTWDRWFTRGDWDFRTGLRWNGRLRRRKLASPRFSVNWRPGKAIRYFATAGLFHQSPRFLQLAANESNDLENEEITHGSFGVEYVPNSRWSILTEAYYQNLDNLVVDLDRARGTFANIGDGTSYGFDIVARGTLREGIYATATYSYNDAEVDRKDGRGDAADDFSREHVATLGLTWEITDRWKVAGRYKYLPAGRGPFVIPRRFGTRTTPALLAGDHERMSGAHPYGLLNARATITRIWTHDVTPFRCTT